MLLSHRINLLLEDRLHGDLTWQPRIKDHLKKRRSQLNRSYEPNSDMLIIKCATLNHMFGALLSHITYRPLGPNRHLGPNTATMAYEPVQQTRQVTRLLLGDSQQQTRHLTRLLYARNYGVR